MTVKKEDKVVLAVDLDEVVFNYLAALRNRMLIKGMTVAEETPTSFLMAEAGWFESDEAFKKFHGEAVEDGIYSEMKCFDGASEVLNELCENGYEINIVTSRFVNGGQHQKVLSQTAEALDREKIPYSNIMFLSNKTRFIADTYIDDGPHNLIPLRDNGRHVIAYSWAYNESVDGVDRANNWYEIREILRERYGK